MACFSAAFLDILNKAEPFLKYHKQGRSEADWNWKWKPFYNVHVLYINVARTMFFDSIGSKQECFLHILDIQSSSKCERLQNVGGSSFLLCVCGFWSDFDFCSSIT
jgi:hypothetical protein